MESLNSAAEFKRKTSLKLKNLNFKPNSEQQFSFDSLRFPLQRDFDFFSRRKALINNHKLNEIYANYKNGGYRTIVVIPSMSFCPECLDGIYGISEYESRSLWEILRAACPRTNVIYCSVGGTSEVQINHLLDSANVSRDTRNRITFIDMKNDCPTNSLIPLSQIILENTDIMQRLKN